MESSLPLAAWQPFYAVIGAAAAALVGLTFVVITLMSTLQREVSDLGVSVFTTPTVVHFGAALLISASLCAPWHTLTGPAVILALAGVVGFALAVRTFVLSHAMDAYEPDAEDWVWYTILPGVAYGIMLLGALLLAVRRDEGLFFAAAATAFLLIMGIRNAWDVVTYITIRPDEPES